MKTKKLFLALNLALSLNIFSQTVVNKTVVEIPQEFSKAKIALVDISSENELKIVLLQEKKKNIQLYQFTFDANVNKKMAGSITETSISTTAPINSRNAISNQASVGQKDHIVRFVRVVPSSFWGEMELEKGYIERSYVDGIFVGESFVPEKKITNIRTPDDRKIVPISEMHVGIDNQTQTTKTLGLDKNYGFLSAGNLIAVGGVFPKLLTKGRLGVGDSDTYIDYCVVRADAKKLAIEAITLIPFKYVQQTELCREVTADKKMILITKDFPLAYKGAEEFYHKDSQTRTVTIIDKNGGVERQVTFEGLEDMTIVGADMLENGNIYVLARSGQKKNMGIVAIKIENGKVVYNDNNPMINMDRIAVKPSMEKKGKLINECFPYLTKKTNTFRGVFELENHNMIAIFQNPGAEGYLFYLQFDETGKLITHYSHSVSEDLTASSDGKTMRAIDFFIRQNNHSGFYPIIMEKSKNGCYFKTFKIDGVTHSMSDFLAYGRKSKEDKNEYYLDKTNPGIDTFDGGFIMISRTKDNKLLCVQKIIFE